MNPIEREYLVTKLTAPTTAKTASQLFEQIERARGLGAEAIEVRLDYLTEPVDYPSVLAAARLPVIWTNRHVSEGGACEKPEAARVKELIDALRAGGDCIDMEYRRWSADPELRWKLTEALAEVRAGGRDVRLVLSYHDFAGVPDDLEQTAERMEREGDVVKFAVTARDVFDNFRVFKVMRECRKPVIGLAMGPHGQISRILAKKLGGEITFASIEAAAASAPGQLTVAQMRETYNWDRIGNDTKVLGVVGHPVEHSLSPPMHNAAYRAMGFDGLYLRFCVSAEYEAFARFVDLVRDTENLDIIGLSVTIPHKANAIRYLQEHGGRIDPLAEKIGAVNTLVFHLDGSAAGYNTDYLGVLAALELEGGLGSQSLAGKRVAVLGAGGVSRAIVAAMTSSGAEVTVFNRTAEKAQSLADEFDCRAELWDRREQLRAEVLINGTSIGMWPRSDESPIDPLALRPEMVVFDTVYNPLWTKLLTAAQQGGAKAVDGASMLVYQAVEQIRLWTQAAGSPCAEVPVAVMRDVVLRHLKGNG